MDAAAEEPVTTSHSLKVLPMTVTMAATGAVAGAC